MTLIVGIHEAHVKSGIVGNQNRILAEFLELLQDLFQRFGIANMIIGNACQIRCKGGNGVPWIDKLIKFSNDIALVHFRRGNLNQIIVNC